MAMMVKNNYGGYTNAVSRTRKEKHGAAGGTKAKKGHGKDGNHAVTLEISEQARRAQEAAGMQVRDGLVVAEAQGTQAQTVVTATQGKPIQTAATVQEKQENPASVVTATQGKPAQTAATVQENQNTTATKETSGLPSFSNTKELMEYLKENYHLVRQGMASISGKYLRDCLTDEEKLKKLFENLAAADERDAYDREHLKGYQGMRVKIDENGDMATESGRGWVNFNEAKRARQLAAAKTQANVQTVMALLQQDLAECEAGKSRGMCDDETIGRVQAMIANAQQKMAEVSGEPEEENPADEQAFLMAGMM